MKREKIEDRVYIPKNLKAEILLKSKNRCCHCGKKLRIGVNFTLEHFIPLSKGGTNNITNLVALCEKCNKVKTNHIVNPKEYYPYLNKRYIKDLSKYYIDYLENFDWLGKTNVFKEDIIVLDTYKPYESAKKIFTIKSRVTFTKAIKYSDFDDLLAFVMEYNKFVGIKDSKCDVASILNHNLDNGCIYIMRDAKGGIKGLIPVSINKYKGNDLYYGFSINMPILDKSISFSSNIVFSYYYNLLSLFIAKLVDFSEDPCAVYVTIHTNGFDKRMLILLSLFSDSYEVSIVPVSRLLGEGKKGDMVIISVPNSSACKMIDCDTEIPIENILTKRGNEFFKRYLGELHL